MEQGSFWSQSLRTSREYHETRWKGIGESKKQAIAAFESGTPRFGTAWKERIFPGKLPAQPIWKYLSKHTLQEPNLTGPRVSPKLDFKTRISLFG